MPNLVKKWVLIHIVVLLVGIHIEHPYHLTISSMAFPRLNARAITRSLLLILALALAYGSLSMIYNHSFPRNISSDDNHIVESALDLDGRNPYTPIQKARPDEYYSTSRSSSDSVTNNGSASTGGRRESPTAKTTIDSVKVSHKLPPPPSPGQDWAYPDHYPPFYNYFAVAVKSGRDTALVRLPIQLLTFLKRLDKFVFIGESGGLWVGHIPLKDVYTGVYEEAERNLAKKNLTKRSLPIDRMDGAGSRSSRSRLVDQRLSIASLDFRNSSSCTLEAETTKPWWTAVKTYTDDTMTNLKQWCKSIINRLSADPSPRSEGRTDQGTSIPCSKNCTSKTLHRRSKPNEGIVPNSESQGWKLDAHKNLPGFRHLFESHPDALWYFMIDDDTYIFIDNLVRLLKPYNPYDSHYFGAHNLFVGCDGVKAFGEGPAFAHGGSGIVLSRGAMLKLMSVLDQCILRLEGQPGFNGEPPNSRFGWPVAACDKPYTFHHATVSQIQKIAHAEEFALIHNPESVVTYADIFREFSKDLYNSQAGMEADTNRPGNDFENSDSDTPQICESKCKANSMCMAWTWEKSTDKACWLKHGIPSPTTKEGAVSGVVARLPDHERYKCIWDAS
ncbi:hypothetical protein SeMB42_g01575 [Synchytrium endobioticum]|uniref:N-acetylgalactosaminide beta-1,3-galactosyltransferase n=1 Tax=Synchytrium endobioticum TaxID=286115 RepID=A0A507DMY0_9FUNG|nr:hypothetical protein SeMB42_g01575 [Synchytrium endobioticum]